MTAKTSVAGTEHDLNYRRDVLSKFFGYIKQTDSFYAVGAASMGKTRLLDFLARESVQRHYLGDEADTTWLVRVDLNRMPAGDVDKGFYFFEMLLSSLLLCAIRREKVNEEIVDQLFDLDSDVIKNRDALFALRFFEWEVSKICQKYGIKLCFLFDEFDEAYATFPREIFAQLRAVRDANKHNLLYVMFLRVPPMTLRPGNDTESFYELVSRNPLGIGPYSMDDTLSIIRNLEQNWNLNVEAGIKENIARASGGHAGLIKALTSLRRDTETAGKFEKEDWLDWSSQRDTIIEECRKIWRGLEKAERETLLAAFGNSGKTIDPEMVKLLKLKGILKDKSFFSPFFENYIKSGQAKAEI